MHLRIPNKTQQAERKDSGYFIAIVLLVYAIALLIGITRHEMWPDELQAWLIASQSASLSELFHHFRYESHPALWYLVLYFISRIWKDPVPMQIVHFLIASGSIFLFLKYSPFTRLQKILFTFSYFPLYEYGVISRNYAIGLLLIFAFCALFRLQRIRIILLSCILFLLCQTSVYGLTIAIALGLFLFSLAWREKREGIILSLLIFSAGIFIAIIQIIPPSDTGLAEEWILYPNIEQTMRTLTTVWKAYFPLPQFQFHFWNTNLIKPDELKAALSLMILLFCLLLFLRRPKVLLLFSTATLGLLIFTYILKYIGGLRHHGHIFIIFIICIFLMPYFKSRELKVCILNRLSSFCEKSQQPFIFVILSAQVIAAAYAFSMDLYYPFSGGKAVARFIQEKSLENSLLIGDSDFAATSVAGYLGKEIYYPCSDRFGTFIFWNQNRKRCSQNEIFARIQNKIFPHDGGFLLITNYPLDNANLPIREIEKFPPCIVPEEGYYLYSCYSEETAEKL